MALAAHIHIFLSPNHFSSLSHRTYTASQISYGCIYHIPFTNAKRLLLLPLQKSTFRCPRCTQGSSQDPKCPSLSANWLSVSLCVSCLPTYLPMTHPRWRHCSQCDQSSCFKNRYEDIHRKKFSATCGCLKCPVRLIVFDTCRLCVFKKFFICYRLIIIAWYHIGGIRSHYQDVSQYLGNVNAGRNIRWCQTQETSHYQLLCGSNRESLPYHS